MHIALIGYRACGKTTLGKLLADRLHRLCVDVDHCLEQGEGRTIAEIFAKDGEARFRDLEHQYLSECCATTSPLVLSTGGGCILRADNRTVLAESCCAVIYLEAPAEFLAERLQCNAGMRPTLSGASVSAEVADVLRQRIPLYEAVATHRVDATKDLKDLVHILLDIVEN